MSADTKEIESLFPIGKEVTLKGEKIKIKPFGLGKFPRLFALLKKVKEGDVLLDEAGAPKRDEKGQVLMELYNDPMALLSNNLDVAIELIALATDKPLKFFDEVDPVEGLEIGIAIVEVNRDFFTKSLSPKMAEALTRLVALSGGKLSLASLAPGTE